MKVLIVARCKNGKYAPFISEQVEALQKEGVQCRFFGITRKGFLGYLRHIHCFRQEIQAFHPDIIHAHFGLCGLFANIQRRIPVVTTYHGSDINLYKVRAFSRLAISLSAFNIFVSQKILDIAHPHKHYALIPCGVALEDYPVIDKLVARSSMQLTSDQKYILFAGAFDNGIKNAPLAQAAVELLGGPELLELKSYSRSEVAMLMQAVDALLMTSYSEGSPQVIKEAMACGCPIVSVDVGDVKDLVSGLDGCFISSADKNEIAGALDKALQFTSRTEGRARLIKKELTNSQIAARIINEYKMVLS